MTHRSLITSFADRDRMANSHRSHEMIHYLITYLFSILFCGTLLPSNSLTRSHTCYDSTTVLAIQQNKMSIPRREPQRKIDGNATTTLEWETSLPQYMMQGIETDAEPAKGKAHYPQMRTALNYAFNKLHMRNLPNCPGATACSVVSTAFRELENSDRTLQNPNSMTGCSVVPAASLLPEEIYAMLNGMTTRPVDMQQATHSPSITLPACPPVTSSLSVMTTACHHQSGAVESTSNYQTTGCSLRTGG